MKHKDSLFIGMEGVITLTHIEMKLTNFDSMMDTRRKIRRANVVRMKNPCRG
jgi:hypothetical protein